MFRRNHRFIFVVFSFALLLVPMFGLALMMAAEVDQAHRDLSSTESTEQTSPVATAEPHEKYRRLREGTLLTNLLGKFEMTGDRITFYPNDGIEPLRVLENLALERVARELSGIPRQREWRVTGIITEYQGGNFFLVHRAIMKSNSSD